MNPIEERLKDAYLGATQTVRPEAIRGLDEQVATITGRHRRPPPRLYWAAPLAAAAAVAVIGVVLSVGTGAKVAPPPQHHQPAHPPVEPAGSPAERFLGVLSNSSNRIFIINATSGDTVASMRPSDRRDTFGTPATGDGVRYVVATWQPGHCGSTRLEQFTLSSSGQPGKLTELTSLRRSVSHLWILDLAVSGDGKTIAFWASTCVSRLVAVNTHLGVIKLPTGRITNWTLPDKSIEYPMSLTRNGHVLEYNSGEFGPSPSASAVYLLPTNAAPGPADGVSRTLITAAQVGSNVVIAGATIDQNGAGVLLYTRAASMGANITSFELRKVSVATGRIKLIGRYRGDAVGSFAVDPAGRRAIASIDESQAFMIDLRTGRGELLDPTKWMPNNGGYFW